LRTKALSAASTAAFLVLTPASFMALATSLSSSTMLVRVFISYTLDVYGDYASPRKSRLSGGFAGTSR
jgi:hypothetical protein